MMMEYGQSVLCPMYQIIIKNRIQIDGLQLELLVKPISNICEIKIHVYNNVKWCQLQITESLSRIR